MFYLQHQNANGQKIAVTSTATRLFDLINTAASTTLSLAGFSHKANGLNITPEDGDIRVVFAEGITPTSSLGEKLSQGTTYFFRNIPLEKMKLIRVGSSNVNCSVVVGICDPSEVTAAVTSFAVGNSPVSSSNPLPVSQVTVTNYEVFADTSFVTGDSPVTLDVNAALGRNGTRGVIKNNGAGDLIFQLSSDGITFGDNFTLQGSTNSPTGAGEVFPIEYFSVDSIKITWSADTAYQVYIQ